MNSTKITHSVPGWKVSHSTLRIATVACDDDSMWIEKQKLVTFQVQHVIVHPDLLPVWTFGIKLRA